MMVFRIPLVAALLLALAAGSAAQQPKKKGGSKVGPPRAGSWYVDDEAVFDNLMDKLTVLAKAGKPLAHEKLRDRLKPGKPAVVAAKPGDKAMLPEEVYKQALPSVFVLGSVFRDKKTGDWQEGRYGTAWAITADGVLVTNWHLFEELEYGEVFGASDHKGTVYPVTDFLGGDKVADIAFVKLAGSGFTPLPVATTPAEVGSWVGVLGHPSDHFYAFTQGHVTRFNRSKTEDGQTERWMSVTADYAGGSSGSPVLNRYGAVVGMAAVTVTLDSGEDEKPKGDDPKGPPPAEPGPAVKERPKDPPPRPEPRELVPPVGPREEPKEKKGDRGPAVQMVVKMTVPSASILRSLAPPPAKGP
jgi:S1-C subfamily serine protease